MCLYLFLTLHITYRVLHPADRSHFHGRFKDINEMHNYYIITQVQYKEKCYPFKPLIRTAG